MNQSPNHISYETEYLFADIHDRIRCMISTPTIKLISLNHSICLYSHHLANEICIIGTDTHKYRISATDLYDITGVYAISRYNIENWTAYDTIFNRIILLRILNMLDELDCGSIITTVHI